MPVLLPPDINQSAVQTINGEAGRRGKAPPTQLVRRTVGPAGRATAGAQAGNGDYPSRLRSGDRQPRVKLVGESPREPHRWMMGHAARHPPFIWGNVGGGGRGGIHPERLPEAEPQAGS